MLPCAASPASRERLTLFLASMPDSMAALLPMSASTTPWCPTLPVDGGEDEEGIPVLLPRRAAARAAPRSRPPPPPPPHKTHAHENHDPRRAIAAAPVRVRRPPTGAPTRLTAHVEERAQVVVNECVCVCMCMCICVHVSFVFLSVCVI